MVKKPQTDNINVVVRVRPMNEAEKQMEPKPSVTCHPDGKGVTVQEAYVGDAKQFTFDRVFSQYSTQEDVFDEVVTPILDSITNGFNAAVIAYGQTGSGKTHTMMGQHSGGDALDEQLEDQRGLIPRILDALFKYISHPDANEVWFCAVSYVQIYRERILDLLDDQPRKCEIHEDKNRGLWVTNAIAERATRPADVIDLLKRGEKNKVYARTNMNAQSSRSHSVLLLSTSKTLISDRSETVAQLYLVDLAGSESVDKTGSEGELLNDAKSINGSLLALRNVINALTSGAEFVNYRDSKLTRLLQNSFGGNCKTTLVACVSPSDYNKRETVSTLRFADSARHITNKATANVHRSVQELTQMLNATNQAIAQTNQEIKEYENLMAMAAEMDLDDLSDEEDECAFGKVKSITEVDVTKLPAAFRCPLSGALMIDPVVAADGYTYERASIEGYLEQHNCTPPLLHKRTPQPVEGVADRTLFANMALRDLIAYYNAHPL